MLTIMISIAMMSSNATGSSTTPWLQSLLSSPRAKKVESLTKRPSPKTDKTDTGVNKSQSKPKQADSGRYGVESNGSPLYDPELEESLKIGNEERLSIDKLLNDRCYKEAYREVSRFLVIHPECIFVLRDVKADCAIFVGRYEEAYELLEPLVRRQGLESPQFLLALSVSSALLGEVYPGQANYCRERAFSELQNVPAINYVPLDPDLARKSDAKSVAIMSCIGLGMRHGRSDYLELALTLDPSNVAVGRALVTFYQDKDRKWDIRRIAQGMLKVLPVGHSRRDDFEKVLADSQ